MIKAHEVKRLRRGFDATEDVLLTVQGEVETVRRVLNLIESDMVILNGMIRRLPDSPEIRATLLVSTVTSAIAYESDDLNNDEWIKFKKQELANLYKT